MIPISRFLICLLALATLLPASAAPVPVGPDVAVITIRIGKEKLRQRVVIGLYDTTTPLTVANFKELAADRFFRGMRFHRVFPDLLVQTGDPNSRRGESDKSGTGGPGYTVPAEIRHPHMRGAVVMSRLADTINPTRASSGSQFYVCLAPMPQLDGKYTVFGEVLEGIEVLDAISKKQTDSNDFPLEKIVIESITILPRESLTAIETPNPEL